MKSFISLALLGLAAAGPVQRRGMTEVVVTTEWTTTTVYVSPATGAAFAEGAKSSSPIPSLPASSAPAAPSVPVPEPTPTPSPAPAPAAPSPAPAVPVAAAAPAPNAGSGASTLKSGTGQGTYYDVTVGLGSCGLAQAGPNDPVVALALGTMNNGANSNKNPLCGKAIYITYQGATHRGMVYDSCAGCAAGDVDFSDGFFKQVMPHGDGRVDGVSWVIKDEPF